MSTVFELDPIAVSPSRPQPPSGSIVLKDLLDAAGIVMENLQSRSASPCAALGRVRGTGRGVSFSSLIARLEADHPVEVRFPFEGSDHVGGGVWRGDDLIHPPRTDALAKLHWKPGARDLPMHTHEHSDRFIVVLGGRGYFHVSDEPLEDFTGGSVRTIPARERDVFAFTRGVVHTFSTEEHGMTLLSCQLPFLPLDDPKQYTLPEVRWTAQRQPADSGVDVVFEPVWQKLCWQDQ